MNDDDFRAIIALVEQRLRDVGANELANPDLYVRRDEEIDEWRRLSPQEHLLDMLKAFDRWLAVRDGATFAAAQERINDLLKEGRLEDAVVISTGEAGDGATVSLAKAPDLGPIRDELRRLIGQLRGTRPRGGEGRLDA